MLDEEFTVLGCHSSRRREQGLNVMGGMIVVVRGTMAVWMKVLVLVVTVTMMNIMVQGIMVVVSSR